MAQLKAGVLKPTTNHFLVSTRFNFLSTKHFYDQDGNNVSLLGSPNFNPALKHSILYLSIDYSLFNNFGLKVGVPYIADCKLEANPDPGYFADDAIGDKGIGDSDLGVWYQIETTLPSTIVLSANYHFQTGTSPYEMHYETDSDGIHGHNQPFSTGLGYSYIDLNATTDLPINNQFYASFFLGYLINQKYTEDSYYKDKSKKGNVVQTGARLLYKPQKPYLFSLSLQYSVSGNHTNLMGEERENSNFYILSILPQFALDFNNLDFIDNINIGYNVPLSGKNYINIHYFTFGIDFSF